MVSNIRICANICAWAHIADSFLFRLELVGGTFVLGFPGVLPARVRHGFFKAFLRASKGVLQDLLEALSPPVKG